MKNSNIENYKQSREDEEKKVIDAIHKREKYKNWTLEQSSFKNDMNGIDAVGVIKTKKKGDIKILVQIKNVSWLKLSIAEQEIYLYKISKNMNKLDSEANQRLILYSTNEVGAIYRLYNYNIKNKLKEWFN